MGQPDRQHDPPHRFKSSALEVVDGSVSKTYGLTAIVQIEHRQIRCILTDLYRAGVCQKREENRRQFAIDASTICAREPRRDLMTIDEALERLARIDARKGQVVELQFLGGLSVKETADSSTLGDTIYRD